MTADSSDQVHARVPMVVLTTSYPLNECSNSGKFVEHLNQALQHWYDIRVVCPADAASSPESGVCVAVYAPARYRTLAHGPGGIPVALRSNPFLALAIPSFLFSLFVKTWGEARHARIILSHWSISGLVGGLVARILGINSYVVFHGSDANLSKKSFLFNLVARLALQLNSGAIVVSNGMSAYLKKQFPRYARKVRFVANGIDERLLGFPAEVGKHPVLRMLVIGNLNPLKGVRDAIDALARSRARPSLTIVGDGEERVALENRVIELGLGKQVVFTGILPQMQLFNLFRESDVLLLPSYSEGRSSVLLEALAAGLAVICSSIPPNLEVIRNECNGLCFAPGDVGALAFAMDRLNEDRDLLRALSRAGRETIYQEQLTWQATAQRYHELFTLQPIDR